MTIHPPERTRHPIGAHIGPGLTDDNQLLDGGPLARAADMDADGVQIFLTDPQSYKSPKPRPDADDLLATMSWSSSTRPTCSTWRRRTTGSASRAASSWPSTRGPPRPSAPSGWWSTA